MIKSILAIFIGGGLGSLMRFGVNAVVDSHRFPWGTMVANALASLLLGVLVGWISIEGEIDERLRLFLVTGLCGGFSTFSTFSYESLKLWQQGEHFAFFANIGGSVTVCLVCIFLGLKLISAIL